MCDTCVTDPPITTVDVIEHAAVDPHGVLQWLAHNAPVEFMRFVISEYPDAVAEYMNLCKDSVAHAHLLAAAGGN